MGWRGSRSLVVARVRRWFQSTCPSGNLTRSPEGTNPTIQYVRRHKIGNQRFARVPSPIMSATIFPELRTPGTPAPGWVPAPTRYRFGTSSL